MKKASSSSCNSISHRTGISKVDSAECDHGLCYHLDNVNKMPKSQITHVSLP